MIQDDLQSMGNSACLALCYLKAGLEMKGQSSYDQDLLNNLAMVYYSHMGIDADCWVYNPDLLFKALGLKVKVTKQNGNDVNAAEYVVANYHFNGKNHFVLYKNGQLYFNSLANSKCVQYGEIRDIRILQRV